MEPQRERSVQEIALNNPIILTKILQHYSAPLKSCRLVSHFWSDMVLSLQNTTLALNLNSKDAEYENDPIPFLPFFDLCSKMDARLAKRISADTSNCTEENYSLPGKLGHLFLDNKFSDQVQILEMWVDYEECLPSIFQVFKKSCPNLKQLRIRCAFEEEDYTPHAEILVERLPQKPNLTVFELSSDVVTASPTLTSFIQGVVSASPNLKEVTLPWGVYPDLATAQVLTFLTLELDDARPLNDALAQLKPSELARMLNQVGDQLVHLAFSYTTFNYRKSMLEDYDLDNLITPSGFHLPEKMSKLETFENKMIDIIRHADLWQDIGRMPALESLKIGKVSKKETSVEAVLKNLYETERIFTDVTELWIHELYDPKCLKGLKTAFPNLETLVVDSLHEMDDVSGMKLGGVLKACKGLDMLTHLDLQLPTYPEKIWDVVKALINGSELYKELQTLIISTHSRNHVRHDLTESQTYLFKGLLVAMKEMDFVIIRNLSFGDESKANILDFMASNEMPVSKFKVLEGTDADDDSDSE